MRERINFRGEAERTSLMRIGLSFTLLASACAVSLARVPAQAAASQKPTPRVFKEVATGKAMPAKGALQASFHSYKSEDGSVTQLREWYKSASDADSGLNILMKNASRVIRQGTKIDAKGSVVGKRVELVFSRGREASPEMVIAWTDDADLVRLTSTSMPLLLDFEGQYYPGGRSDKEH